MYVYPLCLVAVASQVLPETIDDGVQLLQTKLVSKFGLNPVEGEAQAPQHKIATIANLASLDTYITDMEGRRGDGGGQWGEDESSALEAFKITLTDQFQQFLDDEHASDIANYNVKKDVHNVCITHASNDFADDPNIISLSSFVTKTKNKHKACRKSLRSWTDYKNEAIRTESCAGASDLTTEHDIYAQHQILFAKMTLAETQAQEYASLEEVGTKRACDVDQSEYENKWCEWRDARGSACEGLKSCIDQVNLVGLKGSLLVRASNRRMLWLSIDTMLCRIAHLLSTFDDTTDTSDFSSADTCNDTEPDNTKFVLSLDVPPYTPCAGFGTDVEPGGTGCTVWIEQEYNWPITTHDVPVVCQTSCPTYTPAPPPPAGCETDSVHCAVYNSHPDECGTYDADLGIVNTDCCACAPVTAWETVVELGGTGTTVVTDVGAAQFNDLFSQCPVVQYWRNGAVHSVYVRTSPININAYEIFTETWKSAENTLNQDFKIYDSLADAEANQNSWTYCNYNDPDVAYPRDCGRSGGVGSMWFTMPGDRFDIRGISAGAKFEIFTGSTCPSSVR